MALELERLDVRCLEANVELHIEALSGPGPDTDRDEETVDRRLVDRFCGSFDTDRCAARRVGKGGASIFPREGPDRGETDRCV